MNAVCKPLALLSLVMLSACQSSAPTPTDYSAQTKLDAEKFAFTQVRQLAALANECQSVNNNVFNLAQSALQNWHRRNDATIAAAHAAYMLDVVNLQSLIGPTKGQLPSLKFLMDMEEQVAEEIRSRVATSSDKERTCQRRLDFFNSESGDLHANAQHGPVFIKLKNDYPSATVPAKLPNLSVSYTPRRNAGRSFYAVESTMKEKNCQPLIVFNLESNWPNELYAASCSHDNVEAYYLIHCEWEQCKFGPEQE